VRSCGATGVVGRPKYGIFKEKRIPNHRICSLCGKAFKECDGKVLSLVGSMDDTLTRVPFHLECLLRHRGNRNLRRRIVSVIGMIDDVNRNKEGMR